MKTLLLLTILLAFANADIIRFKNGIVIENCTILEISDAEITYRDALGVRTAKRSEVEAFASDAPDMQQPALVQKRSLRLIPVAAAMAIFSYATWMDAKDLTDDINDLKDAGIDATAKLETRRNRLRTVAVLGSIATAAITIAAFQDVTVGFADQSLAVSYRF